MNWSRIIKAIFIAPLSAYPVFVIPILLLEPRRGETLLVGVYAVVVAYAGMLIIGVPSISLLRYLHATRWWQLTSLGALGGACIGWVAGETLLSLDSALGALFGTVVAGTTWYIAFRRRPTPVAVDPHSLQRNPSDHYESQA